MRRRRSTTGPTAPRHGPEAALPADLKQRRSADPKPKKQPRDVFVYFIHEAKVRAPAAAMALIERVGKPR